MKFTNILYDALFIAEFEQTMETHQPRLQFEYDNDDNASEMVDQVLDIYDDLRDENTLGLLTITLSNGKVVELDSESYDYFVKYEEENPIDTKDINAAYLQSEDGLFQELRAILTKIDNIRDVLFFIEYRDKISEGSDISLDLNNEITDLEQTAKGLIIQTMATNPVDPFMQMIIHNDFENEYGEQPLLDFLSDLGLLDYLRLKYNKD
ncbi:hypothetical protein [Trichococcus pasteurii]|uniref:Uncharacterized protein n=1 Tax=Trichococcus pasteurii TaxID=43064 RepID=A0A1W1IKB8_9LACT|nr:hypothetical protein [Trichococcus pasteurii]SFF12563.1 hypothetical protein SAMN04488086_1335 [Trichococcus pasteurii]SLM53252.1 Hypothetical protein TPAS_2980 [Trichococcus pasteurii]SLM53269.1 Hypothetical protein TPAS_2997 [Trichococcus pasteurii]SSB94133.1 Hypothetical protein TPAS_2980 [Trichococcus pasteurii]SSB94150.1 Hypothetical protein TPAS_2997 [Trichococcus pasteurii]